MVSTESIDISNVVISNSDIISNPLTSSSTTTTTTSNNNNNNNNEQHYHHIHHQQPQQYYPIQNNYYQYYQQQQPFYGRLNNYYQTINTATNYNQNKKKFNYQNRRFINNNYFVPYVHNFEVILLLL